MNKLKTCTYVFLSHCFTAAEELKNIRVLFERLDVNGDGRLSKAEIHNGIKEYCDGKQTNLTEILKNCDIDDSGFIDYSEFLTCVVSNDIAVSRNSLEIAFNAFDKDGNGKISKAELCDALIEFTDCKNIESIIKEIDSNGDGEIDLQEFTVSLLKSSNI